MIAHYHGQVWNGAEFARSLGTSENTARRYLDILAGAYMVKILPPWFENIGKRQIKAQRSTSVTVEFSMPASITLPKRCARASEARGSWEGFALEQLLTMFELRDAYFWELTPGRNWICSS